MSKSHFIQKMLMITFLTHASFSMASTQKEIIKSSADSRVYQTFTLDNEMEVLLASDPSLTQTAVSLTVGVGQFQDPDSQPGLAHYLEHMIFMGSEHYPEPNKLHQLVKTNNGFINALTEAQQTSYFFNIASEKADIAMDMLSNAIQAPLFRQEFSKKELKALDAEWQLSKQSDQFSMFRTNAITANKNHPMGNLGLGNLKTLNDKPNSILQEELERFYQQNYSANIMKLALVGNQSLKDLKLLAIKHFSKVPNKHIKRPITNEGSFTDNELRKHIFLKTDVETDVLTLQFPLKDNSKSWMSKPNMYVNYILSSEEVGALVPTLREAGFIEGMHAILNSTSYGVDGTAMISFVLTEKGKNHKDDIISAFFQYIKLIQTHGVSPIYAKELNNILKNQFSNFQEPGSLALATTFSRQMLVLPTADILHYSTYFSGLNETEVKEVLAQITPKKMRLWHISNAQKTNTELKFANGTYRIESFNSRDLELWHDSKLSVKLPEIVDIDKKVDVATVVQSLSKPKLIINDSGVQGWLMHSQHFNNNQGITGVVLESPLYQKDAKNHVMTSLVLTMFNKDLQRLIQRAAQRHQVYISGGQNQFGNISFNVAGVTEHHPEYLNNLLKLFKTFRVEQSDLDRAVKSLREITKNINKAPLAVQATNYSNQMLKVTPFIWDEKLILAALDSVSLTDVKQFHHELMSDIYIDLFAFGNYDSDMSLNMAKESRSLFGMTKIKHEFENKIKFKPQPNTVWNEKKSVSQEHVFLKDTYIYPEVSMKVTAQLKLLNMLFEAPFFKELRTKKQLAYDIGSYQENVEKHPAFTLYIQSINTDLSTLKKYFYDFIEWFLIELIELDDSVFDDAKKSILNSLNQKPQNIYAESTRYFSDWLDNNYEFDSHEKLIDALQITSKKDLLSLYKKMLIDGYSANVLIQLRGTKFSNTDYFNDQALKDSAE